MVVVSPEAAATGIGGSVSIGSRAPTTTPSPSMSSGDDGGTTNDRTTTAAAADAGNNDGAVADGVCVGTSIAVVVDTAGTLVPTMVLLLLVVRMLPVKLVVLEMMVLVLDRLIILISQ